VSSTTAESIAAEMRAAVKVRGLNGLAKALGTSRISLGSYFAGCAREGTALLLETRFRALQTQKHPGA
jgi:hypothetical protein